MPPKTLADDPSQEFLAVLWYGPPGTGKTTDLAYMAHLGNVAYIRADRSVRRRPLTQLGVPVGNIEPIDELDTEALVKMIPKFRQRLEEDPESLAGVAVDTITELLARRMEAIVDLEWKKYVAKCRRDRMEPEADKRYFVSRDYWQPITQEMRRFVRQMKDLQCHLAISAQPRKDTDEDDGTVQIGPSVNPAFQGDLQAYMDFVIRTASDGFWPGTDESIFVGYPRHMGKYAGKDREHVLPSRLVEPTFDRVLAYARGELTKDNDARQEEYRQVVARRKKAKPQDDLDDLDD
jgi:hypothetical protein